MKISVVMATYNGAKYIYDQVSSILTQLSEGDEIIISDDSSTDDTLNIVRDFKDPRIKIYINQYSRGPIQNFENALLKSTGDYIFLADQDDVWYENKIAMVVDKLKYYDCVVHNADIVDEDLNFKKVTLFDIYRSKKGIFKNIYKNSFVGCCMAFNKKILNKALPFPPQIPMHDSWIGLVSEKNGKSLFLNETLIYYRDHGNNATTTGSGKSNQTFSKKLFDRFQLSINILLR